MSLFTIPASIVTKLRGKKRREISFGQPMNPTLVCIGSIGMLFAVGYMRVVLALDVFCEMKDAIKDKWSWRFAKKEDLCGKR